MGSNMSPSYQNYNTLLDFYTGQNLATPIKYVCGVSHEYTNICLVFISISLLLWLVSCG